jgi:citrate synthase
MRKENMGENRWSTELSYTTEDGICIRGYDLVDLIGNVSFPSALYLLFTGELPNPKIARLFEAVMVASIDHGPGAPSALAARTAASGSGSLGQSVAAGLLALGKHHGAAIEDSMDAILRVTELASKDGSYDAAAESVIADRKREGKRIGGFGHRQHKQKDPRLERLLSIAGECELKGDHIKAMYAIERALGKSKGSPLPVNIDGAVAVIFCEIGFPKTLANAVFMASRFAGIIAHAHEEIERMPPMRRIDPVDHYYSGTPKRELPREFRK